MALVVTRRKQRREKGRDAAHGSWQARGAGEARCNAEMGVSLAARATWPEVRPGEGIKRPSWVLALPYASHWRKETQWGSGERWGSKWWRY